MFLFFAGGSSGECQRTFYWSAEEYLLLGNEEVTFLWKDALLLEVENKAFLPALEQKSFFHPTTWPYSSIKVRVWNLHMCVHALYTMYFFMLSSICGHAYGSVAARSRRDYGNPKCSYL